MSAQFQIEETPDYLAVRVTSASAIEEISRQFERIGECCERANINKLLLDFTGAPASICLGEKYFLGVQSQDLMLHKVFKVAVVSRPEHLDYQKFGEMVARNRGVNARVFTCVEDAEEWLSK